LCWEFYSRYLLTHLHSKSRTRCGIFICMKHYYIIYKPYLVLSQFTSQQEQKTLADFFPVPKDVYAVGRLDYDSEGLLILTNDTSLNHRLLNPAFEHERAYWVQVDGAITDEAIGQLQQGVEINVDGRMYRTKQCTVKRLNATIQVPERNPPIRFRKEIPAPWIEMTLREGKNRQVRKMTAKAGFPTLRLIRQRIVNLELGTMQPGDMIELPGKTIYKKLGLA
jgi:23S rRNA pseudouridine2457 synthase